MPTHAHAQSQVPKDQGSQVSIASNRLLGDGGLHPLKPPDVVLSLFDELNRLWCWLARKDSNLQSPDPESGALPLGHSPASRSDMLSEGPSPPRLSAASPTATGSAPLLAPRLDLAPGVLERERSIEDELFARRIGIRTEVANPLELHGLAGRHLGQRRLYQAAESDLL